MSSWVNGHAHDKIALIVKFWEPGIASGELASLISDFAGERVTRNAVIGVYSRASAHATKTKGPNPLRDFPLNEPNELPIRREMSREAVKKGRIPRPLPSRFNDGRGPTSTAVVMDDTSSIGLHLPLEDLRANQCRWATRRISERWMFCALPTEGGSFCPHHTVRAYDKFQLEVDGKPDA